MNNNWVNAITLVSYTGTKDSDGFEVPVETMVEHIPAKFKSATRKDEEHSNKLGYTADLIVEMMTCNYSNQETLIDEATNKRYAIKRAYEKSPEIIELTCSDVKE